MVSKLNTARGSELGSAALFGSRLTVYTPWIALAVAVMLGLIATRMRKLEMASALHCGVPKTALLTQIGLETLVWAIAGVLIYPARYWHGHGWKMKMQRQWRLPTRCFVCRRLR